VLLVSSIFSTVDTVTPFCVRLFPHSAKLLRSKGGVPVRGVPGEIAEVLPASSERFEWQFTCLEAHSLPIDQRRVEHFPLASVSSASLLTSLSP
jgi:hypothetical protein